VLDELNKNSEADLKGNHDMMGRYEVVGDFELGDRPVSESVPTGMGAGFEPPDLFEAIINAPRATGDGAATPFLSDMGIEDGGEVENPRDEVMREGEETGRSRSASADVDEAEVEVRDVNGETLQTAGVSMGDMARAGFFARLWSGLRALGGSARREDDEEESRGTRRRR